MPAPDPRRSDPFIQGGLRYADVLGRIIWRNLKRLGRPPAPALPLRFPNRTPGIWAGWLGHATVLLHLYGSRVLTDPLLTGGLALARRLVALPLRVEELPELEAVVITHAHYDHLNRASLKLLPRRATLVVPQGCADLVSDLGFRTLELGWGEEADIDGLMVRAFRPRHWGRRPPFGGERGYNAYLLTRQGRSILVAGDTAYTGAFAQECQGADIALALLPIGCYRPDFFQRAHLSPEQALRLFAEVGADYMLPIHWGTLLISLEPPEEPARRLLAEAARTGLTERVRLVPPGGEFAYPGT